MVKAGLSVLIVRSPEAAVERALEELVQAVETKPDALVSFDAGVTFAPLLQAVTREVLEGHLPFDHLRATQPREFLGFGPDDAPGMAYELRRHCPPLRELFRDGRFLQLPTTNVSKQALQEHEQQVTAAGGIALQFLGLGPNGYVAGCEPGTPFGAGFDVVQLKESTREQMRWRFADQEPPTHVVTAGPKNILEARCLVLLGFGRDKARIAAEMLEGPVGPGCPASLVQRHRSVLVVLDEEAGKLLDWPESVSATR
jgi:glucosamine-6-phosphate deaminase